MKKLKIKWTKRKVFAIFMMGFYIVIIGVFSPSVLSTYSYIIDSGQQRTFQIPIYFNLNNSTSTLVQVDTSDVAFCLNLTYPYGTLIVNEPVTINASVVLKGDAINKIQDIKIIFQNWLIYPQQYTKENIPVQGALDFTNLIDTSHSTGVQFVNGTFSLYDNTQVIWSVDGDYKPDVFIIFKDGTGYQFYDDAVVIHVYPNEQLTQIYANKVSVALSLAVFIFSFVGVITLFTQLWDYDTTKCKYNPK